MGSDHRGPSVNRQTDITENIAFSQTKDAGGNNAVGAFYGNTFIFKASGGKIAKNVECYTCLWEFYPMFNSIRSKITTYIFFDWLVL